MHTNQGDNPIYLIDPGLALPEYGLNIQEQTQILSYLTRRLRGKNNVPPQVRFKIVFAGDPDNNHPVIAMEPHTYKGDTAYLMKLASIIEHQLIQYVSEQGTDQLLRSSDNKGYYIVDPGLGSSKYELTPDAQVQCLCYLIKRIEDQKMAPPLARFLVIPVKHTGEPYPAIGMYDDVFVDIPENLVGLTSDISYELGIYVSWVGIARLLELSSEETLTWQQVLERPDLQS